MSKTIAVLLISLFILFNSEQDVTYASEETDYTTAESILLNLITPKMGSIITNEHDGEIQSWTYRKIDDMELHVMDDGEKWYELNIQVEVHPEGLKNGTMKINQERVRLKLNIPDIQIGNKIKNDYLKDARIKLLDYIHNH